MNVNLSREQVMSIRRAYHSGAQALELEIQKLMATGLTAKDSRIMVTAVVNQYRKELIAKQEEESHEDTLSIAAYFILVMSTIIGFVFDLFHKPFWFPFSIILGLVAGYMLAIKKPIAGIVAGLTFTVLSPIAFNAYFANRTSYINLEVLLPAIGSALPALLLYFAISAIFYNKK
jgi:hypothetical protein